MARKKLTVHRDPYERKKTTEGYTKTLPSGKKIHVDPYKVKKTHIKGTTYKREDIGAVGKGKKVIPELKELGLTKIAIKHKFIKEDGRVSDIPLSKIDDFARIVAKEVGARKAFGMFHSQVVFRKRFPNGFKKKMLKAREVAGEIGWKGTKRKGKTGYKKKTVRRKHWKTGTPYETTIWVKK